MENETQQCFKCGIKQPLDNFYTHPMMANGHLGKCKECNKREVQENYAKRRLQYSAYDQKRRQDPARKQRQLEYQRARRQREPEKESARRKVAYAIRKGHLIRQVCEKCSNPKSQAHHDDYSKPLNVRWLCFEHHREHHGQTVTVK